MTKKTENKWYTNHCARCGNAHSGYTGKLDSKGVEYVICGNTHKRMNISGTGSEAHNFAFSSKWIKDESHIY